ncbi:polyketide synthase dehydratase domain-containing protein, partial [Micromonospora tarensis]
MTTDIRAVLAEFRAGRLSRDEVRALLESTPATVVRSFRYDEPYLRAHQVFGRQVLLGVTHCALAVELTRAGDTSRHLRGLTFHEPVVLDPGEATEVTVAVAERDGRRVVESRYRAAAASRLSVTAELRDGDRLAELPTLDLDGLRTGHSRDGGQLAANPLLAREPALRCVEQVWVGDGESLGRLRLTADARAALSGLAVHPVLLDGGFVTGAAAVDEAILLPPGTPGMWIPVAIAAVHGSGPLPEVCYCRARVRRADAHALTMDLVLADESGRPLLAVDGFTFRHVRDTQLFTAAAPEGLAVPVAAPEGLAVPVAAPEGPADDLLGRVEAYLAGLVAGHLDVEPTTLDRAANFMELGVQSGELIDLTRRIEDDLGVELYPTLFFEQQCLAELSAYFVAEHASVVGE